ncbi:hypothetical protein [Bacillus wiedmannii]|uniref:hypothetical protein n=1 Tax=Bacillus wiedmannii TaxID=1890302 RepID=UPI0015CF6B64|nr:hypothetical protein [Bacillus wiedmannii]
MPISIKARAIELNPNFHEKREISTASSPPMNTPIGLKFICICRMKKRISFEQEGESTSKGRANRM